MPTAVLFGGPSPQRTLFEKLLSSCLGCDLTVVEEATELAERLTRARPDVLLLGVPDGNVLWLEVIAFFRQHPSCRPPVVLTYGTDLLHAVYGVSDAALRCISQPNELWEHCLMELLIALGLSCETLGRQYVICAMRLVARDPQELTMLTKSLYGQVARLFRSTPEAVEKSMRKQIKAAFQRRDAAAWEYLFPTCCARGRAPSVGEFLRTLHEALTFGEGRR